MVLFMMYSIFIPIFVLCTAFNAAVGGETNWTSRITSKEWHPLRYWFSSCGESINRLTIDGRQFDHVRGISNFYLKVPGTNAIVFVTDENDHSVTFHVFMMDTDEDIAIRELGSEFGQSIGSPRPRDSVELTTNGIVILSTLDNDVKNNNAESKVDAIKSLVYLDLQKKSIIARKTEYYNSGKLVAEGHSR
jgi:hypothetical protein